MTTLTVTATIAAEYSDRDRVEFFHNVSPTGIAAGAINFSAFPRGGRRRYSECDVTELEGGGFEIAVGSVDVVHGAARTAVRVVDEAGNASESSPTVAETIVNSAPPAPASMREITAGGAVRFAIEL